MQKKELYIHVGCPKTGTTTFQKTFFPQIDTIDYCDEHNGKALYSYIKSLFSTSRNKNKYIQKIAEYISNSTKQKILVSDETIALDSNIEDTDKNKIVENIKILSLLKNELKEYCDIKIILTIRNQATIIPSYYAQMGGYREGLFAFTNKIIENKNFDYNYIFNSYKEYFNKKDILIIPMEEIFKNDGFNKIILPFLEIDDSINTQTIQGINKRNIGKDSYKIYKKNNFFSDSFIKLLAFLYQITIKKFIHGKGLEYVNTIVKQLEQVQSLIKGKEQIEKLTYSDKEKEQIVSAYKKGNELLTKEIGINLKKYNYY